MYKEKMAVALKHNGKVLREFEDKVYIPFNSEFSILLKNLNTVRSLVTVYVDGIDVGDGASFVVDPNSDFELERFIKNDNLEKGNRFKFIERTSNIEKHRGVGIEDGLVRIEFNYEKTISLLKNPWEQNTWIKDPWNPQNTKIRYYTNHDNSSNIFGDVIGSTNCSVEGTVNNIKDIQNDVGITVPGSESNQAFITESRFPTETETHVIILQLFGQTKDNAQVVKPVTVKRKQKCITCGKLNKATSKFCSECGTSLNIF